MANLTERFSGPDGTGIVGDYPWTTILAGWRTELGYGMRGNSSSAVVGTSISRFETKLALSAQTAEAAIATLEYKEPTGGAGNSEPARVMLMLNLSANGQTYYGFEVDDRQVDRLHLTKVVNGTRTELLENLSYALPIAPFTMRFEMTPNANNTVTLAGYLNGIAVLSTVDTTAILPLSEYAGIRSGLTRARGIIRLDSVTFGPISETADMTPPSVPVATIYSKDIDRVTVAWEPSSESPVFYRVYQAGILVANNVIDSQYTVTNLLDNTTYSFTVAAVDVASNASAQSTPALTTTYENTGIYIIDSDGLPKIARRRIVQP